MRRFCFKFFASFAVLILTFSSGYYLASRGVSFQIEKNKGLKIIHKEDEASTLNLSLFWKVLNLLEENYYDPEKIEATKLLYGAISGLVDSLGDPYTSFFTPEQNKEFEQQLSGIYEGIGAQLGFRDSQLVIIAPLEDSPAQKVGVQAGDEILAIGKELTTGISLSEAVSKIRGEKGTKVVLTLAREKEINVKLGGEAKKEVFEVEVERAEIKVSPIKLEWKNDNIAYIRIMNFGEDTESEWSRVVEEIQNPKFQIRLEGIILDLRNNPGGYLQAAIKLASDFFEDGIVMQRQLSSGKREKSEVQTRGRLLRVPVVVLINGGSASASEILAGCIWERKRGTIIGEQSFGKGTVQEKIELEKGVGLHITNAKWLLPSGDSIDGVGLKPDVTIEITDDDIKAGRDPQLEKAVEIISR